MYWPTPKGNNSIFDAGKVNLQMDQALFSGWLSGGMISENVLSAGNTLNVLRDKAKLKRISIPVKKNAELCLICSKYQFAGKCA